MANFDDILTLNLMICFCIDEKKKGGGPQNALKLIWTLSNYAIVQDKGIVSLYFHKLSIF